MERKSAMSPMGYAIATIILVGVGMIISAPMIIEKNSGGTHPQPNQEYENREYSSSNDYEIREMERRLNARIDSLESNGGRTYSDKYICSIEGGLDDGGVVVPIDPNNPPAKFVFSCEYKK